MDGRNCSSITGFIFLGITDNTKDKVTIFTMVLIVYLIGHLANLRMIFLIKMDPQLHISMYFSPGHLSSVSSAIPLQFTPRWPWTYLPRTNQSPSMAVLCNSSSSISLQILSVSCWQWWLWPVQGRQQPLALCGQRVQPDVLPAHGWGLSGGNGRYSDTHGISIPLMFLWVKWD